MTIIAAENDPQRKRRIASRVIFCACVLLAAFAASITINDGATVVILPNSLQTVLVIAVSLYLFRPILQGFSFRISPITAFVAVLLALFTVLGMQLNAEAHTLVLHGTVIGTFSTSSSFIGTAVIVIGIAGFALLYYAAVAFAYEKLNGASHPIGHQQATFFGRPIDYRLCLIVLFIAWLPYLIYYFPGFASADMSRHLAQFFGTDGLTIDTHFPYFVALLFGGLYQLGCVVDPSGYLGMFLMVLAQLALGLFVFSSVVVWLSRMGARRALVCGSLAFFALFPLIPAHIVLIDKDTVHAELIVLFTLQILLLFQEKRGTVERSALFSPGAIGAAALLICLTRNNGVILVTIALLVAAVLLKRSWLWGVLGSVMALCCLWQFVLVPQMGVESEGNREALSMPAQVVAAHIVDDLPLTEEERSVAQQSFACALETLAKRYDPLLADGAKGALDVDTPEKLKDFLALTTDLAVQNPAHALSAALATTYGTWYPFCYGTYFGEDVPYVVTPGTEGAHLGWFASYQDLPDMYSRTALGNKMLHGLHYLPGFSLLYAPGTYLWFIIFILGYSLYARRNRRQTVSALALFFALSLVMVFGPCSSLRYSFPFVFSLPLFVALLLDCLPKRPDR